MFYIVYLYSAVSCQTVWTGQINKTFTTINHVLITHVRTDCHGNISTSRQRVISS